MSISEIYKVVNNTNLLPETTNKPWDFLSDEDFDIFINNFDTGDFNQLVEKYPEEVLKFWTRMIICSKSITLEGIQYFQNKGIDINSPIELSVIYNSDTQTPLGYACEVRDYSLVELLLKCGAKFNQNNENNLDDVICNYPVYGNDNLTDLKNGIELLLKHNCPIKLGEYSLWVMERIMAIGQDNDLEAYEYIVQFYKSYTQ